MRFFPSTIKWECRKWLEGMFPCVFAAMLLLLLLWATPTPVYDGNAAWRTFFVAFHFILAIITMVIGLVMVVLYPSISIAVFNSTLAERLSSRRFIVPLVVRLAFAAITYVIGAAIIIGTILLLRDIEWIASIFLQFGCECTIAAHPPEGVICLRTSARELAKLAASLMPILALAMPLYFLFATTLLITDDRDKYAIAFGILGVLWVFGLGVTYIIGLRIPCSDILLFVIYPLVSVYFSCRMIDRYADMAGGAFVW